MDKVIFLIVFVAVCCWACGGKKRDAAYYEQLIDSLRRSEQVKALQKQAGLYDSPVAVFFDTLKIHTLPLESQGSRCVGIENYSTVPMAVNEYFGYAPSAHLHALALPPAHHRQVVLLAEEMGEASFARYLYVMNRRHHPIDILCIEDPKSSNEEDTSTEVASDFFITSDYEITLVQFVVYKETGRRELFQSRRFMINAAGHFEESVIEK